MENYPDNFQSLNINDNKLFCKEIAVYNKCAIFECKTVEKNRIHESALLFKQASIVFSQAKDYNKEIFLSIKHISSRSIIMENNNDL